MYYEGLKELAKENKIELPYIPDECEHNAHMFYIKCKDLDERTHLISYLKENGVNSVFHYVPLHSSPAGKRFGRFNGEDKFTTKESERLIRLPMYYNLGKNDIEYTVDLIKKYYK